MHASSTRQYAMSEASFLKSLAKYTPKLQLGGAPSVASVWHRVPVSRRSLVFVLLFLGKAGELRVLLTQRSRMLRNFPGHISLPGGKADTGLELEWHVARREMHEETGIPQDTRMLREMCNAEISDIQCMPSYLSRTFSVVRPCVGFLRPVNGLEINIPLVLNPGETAGIFSCPLRDFVYPCSDIVSECTSRSSRQVKWGGIPWTLASYEFPHQNSAETLWLSSVANLSDDSSGSDADHDKLERLNSWGMRGSHRNVTTNEKVYNVWGLTALILHDIATVVYGENNNNSEIGQEDLIYSLWKHGKLFGGKERSLQEVCLIEESCGFDTVLPRAEYVRLKRLYRA